MVERKACSVLEASTLGRWWTNVSKTILPIQAKLESLKEKAWGKVRENHFVQEKQVSRLSVICGMT